MSRSRTGYQLTTMVKYILFTIFVSSAFIGCNRNVEVDTTIPRCISDLITEFEKTSLCDDASVDQYIFQEQTVFLFNNGNCGADFQAAVIDRNCNTIGALGGIIGNTEINGEDFGNAVFVKTVWEK